MMTCKVTAIEPLAAHTYQIMLRPEQNVDFKAGQYLLVVMGEKDKRPFSIASSPCRSGELELHIGASEQNSYAMEVVEAMQSAFASDGEITIDVPHGDAFLQQDSSTPLLLIAGGTGFSYVRSILDYCLLQQVEREIYVYWGAKEISQLYAFEDLTQLAQHYPHFHFIPVVESATDTWTGKTGNVLEAVHQDFTSLKGIDIYIAGRFDMAGAAREQFVAEKEAQYERIFGDAFAFI